MTTKRRSFLGGGTPPARQPITPPIQPIYQRPVVQRPAPEVPAARPIAPTPQRILRPAPEPPRAVAPVRRRRLTAESGFAPLEGHAKVDDQEIEEMLQVMEATEPGTDVRARPDTGRMAFGGGRKPQEEFKKTEFDE